MSKYIVLTGVALLVSSISAMDVPVQMAMNGAQLVTQSLTAHPYAACCLASVMCCFGCRKKPNKDFYQITIPKRAMIRKEKYAVHVAWNVDSVGKCRLTCNLETWDKLEVSESADRKINLLARYLVSSVIDKDDYTTNIWRYGSDYVAVRAPSRLFVKTVSSD